MPTILRHLIHDTMIHPHFNTDSVGDQALVSDNYSWELLVANMKVWKRAERQKVEDLFSTLCTFASKELDLSHIFSTVIFANLKRENILRMQQHMLGWTDPMSFGNMLQDATMSAWADWTGGFWQYAAVEAASEPGLLKPPPRYWTALLPSMFQKDRVTDSNLSKETLAGKFAKSVLGCPTQYIRVSTTKTNLLVENLNIEEIHSSA